ncbi:MAG: GHMP kinase [Saprospiraceae bacterium]|nr:GHMP kinase [Saprospiraceae bacterium]
MLKFHSKGKLLLTAEYFVLDGALALALPTKLGQSLQVVENETKTITWKSFDADDNPWFQGIFDLPSGECLSCNDIETGNRLTKIFKAIQKQNPGFLQQFQGLQIETRLEFPRLWGLGTSSTLIANLAQWAGIDPFILLKNTFGGSGYDIACAQANGPILYQLDEQKRPTVKNRRMLFEMFAKRLYFIYLGKKQDSREGIARYREKVQGQPQLIDRISNLTLEFVECKDLSHFEVLIREHEAIVAETLELPRAKALYFQDFWGEVKSLGAWGGDFVLATSDRSAEETKFYFNEKGFETVIPFENLVL